MVVLVAMVSVLLYFMVFIKHMPAYEMSISYWSSDVCSSDLLGFSDRVHDIGTRQREDVVVALLVVRQTKIARIIGLDQLAELDLGPPAAIGQQDAFLRRRGESFSCPHFQTGAHAA